MNPYWLTLIAAIATSMVGQTLLKSGAGRVNFIAQLLDWHTIIGLGLYGGAVLVLVSAFGPERWFARLGSAQGS